MEALARPFADHPRRLLLVVTLFLIPLFSYFFIFPFEIESDVRRGFAQHGGRSTIEFKKFADFYNITYEGLEIWVVLVTPKRNGLDDDLLITQQLLDEVERLDNYVLNFTAPLAGGGSVHFKDLQASEINYLFRWYKKAFEARDLFGSSAINLSFPVAEAFGHRLFLGSHFFGVNRHRISDRGPLERTKYIALWYMSEAANHESKKRLEALQMAIFHESQRDNFSSKMSFWMYGDQVANAEMLRGTMHTVKLFVIGVILMIVFMFFMFNYLTLKSQILLTFAALTAPVIAFSSCFAILGWTGVPFNSIMCITPFLVMGIGVDDAFLLVHCWRRRGSEPSFRKRFVAVVREIGPSMLITSATNALAFGIGIFSPTPQMAGFCLCTSIAVMLDFIFEFLIFVPVMIMHYEEKNEKSKLESGNFSQISWVNYVRLLISPLGKVTVIVFTILLFVSATVGVRKLIPNFDPSKTFPEDSDLMMALRSFEEIQSEYCPVNFISMDVPKANNSWGLERLLKMVDRLEAREYCYGRERSQFILRDFMESQAEKNLTLDYNGLPKYLEERMVAENTIIRLRNNSGQIEIEGINFMVVCRGSLDWNIRASRIDETRKIIDEYTEINPSLFDYDSTIYDLIITVKKELIKAVLLTFVCMVIACAIFIPSVIGTSLAALSMLSISYSLLGWLSIWGQDLDPVTMINVLMAIGFSVDFSAHVCYHYHIDKDEIMPVEHRITHILAAVGRPMVEASLSTLLCMIPLFFVPVYIIISFARTVCLVASLGLIHGIAIIPVILSFLAKEPPRIPERETMLK